MNTIKLTPNEEKALALLKEQTEQWGNGRLAEDIADHEHIYLNKKQAASALISLAKKGLVLRIRGNYGSWGGRGSAFQLFKT